MKILYNQKDITDFVEINMLDVIEDTGEVPDNIEAIFVNAKNEWSDWKPAKDDTLEITNNGYSSGAMFIDEIEQDRDVVVIRAMSIPVDAKTKRSSSWESVSISTIVSDISSRYSFGVQFFNIQNYPYDRVDQILRADFAFLKDRCIYEGLTMKITDKKIIIYDDKFMEGQAVVKKITKDMLFSEPIFKNKSADIYRSCRVSGNGYSGTFTDDGARGSELVVSMQISSQAEAERFAKNILRSYNKKEFLGKIQTQLDTSMTAGNTLEIVGMGLSDGKYFIDNANHSFALGTSTFKIHKCLERF